MVASTPISSKENKNNVESQKPGCETRPRLDQSNLGDIVAPTPTSTRKQTKNRNVDVKHSNKTKVK